MAMVTPSMIEEVQAESPEVKLSKARIEALKLIRQQKLKVIDPRGLTQKIQKNRIDCLIFFHIAQFGWGPATKSISRNGQVKWTASNVPVSWESRFGYPGRGRIFRGCARVRRTCPEAKEYQKAFARFLEVSELYMATKTKKSYNKYLAGKRTPTGRVKAVTESERRKRRVTFIKKQILMLNTLKKIGTKHLKGAVNKKRVRSEARRMIMEATAEMARCRTAIFEIMEVPAQFRNLA